jgi:hypothetical protein
MLPENWDAELFNVILNLVGNLVLLLTTWTIGKSLVFYWEFRQRLRAASLELWKSFHQAYGEFKSLVRMWKTLDMPAKKEDCPDLLREAVDAEGRLEALLSNLSSLRCLKPDEITTLGLYRQGYQTIRQAITKAETAKVPHLYRQPQYKLFNDLTTAVSTMIIANKRLPASHQAQKSFAQVLDVRSEEWDLAVELKDQEEDWKSIIRKVTKERLKN